MKISYHYIVNEYFQQIALTGYLVLEIYRPEILVLLYIMIAVPIQDTFVTIAILYV